MRFGTGRGVAPLLAFTLAAVIATGGVAPRGVQAGGTHHTIPRVVDAVDVHTGGPYFAPPVPGGHYTKDCLGKVADGVGLVRGSLSGLLHGGAGLLHGACGKCGGAGCDDCGRAGKGGLFGHGGGAGRCGHLGHGGGCGEVGHGCGLGAWKGLLHGNGCGTSGGACGVGGGGVCGLGHSKGKACQLDVHGMTVTPSLQAPIVSTHGALDSFPGACTESGCHLKMRHFHRKGQGCNACGGMGCGICHGAGMASGKLCGSCHGGGCGACGGLGMLKHGGLCGGCGGRGCGLCVGAAGVASRLLSLPHSLIAKVCHVGEVEYFMGPGGPVPLTPGYVPYVVTTRSPRDFFAFPPFSDLDP